MNLRLLLFEACNRSCAGCCNKDWDLKNLPVCNDYSCYDLIMLTGGEPMLWPGLVVSYIKTIKKTASCPIIMYTAKVDNLDHMKLIMPYLDGITITLHAPSDILPFIRLCNGLPKSYLEAKSLRLNVFKEVGLVKADHRWKVKNNIEWIPNRSLPINEVFMRIVKGI